MRSVLIVLGIAVLAIIAAVVLEPSKDLNPTPQNENPDTPKQISKAPEIGKLPNPTDIQAFPRSGVIKAVMSIEHRGVITMELYPSVAPKTVAHIVHLIKTGFYNGIRIHRLVPNYIAQLGDPLTKTVPIDQRGIGSHGSGQTVPFEANPLLNYAGTVGLASTGAQTATGDSQFYFNLGNNPALDGSYCVFANVVQGRDILLMLDRGDRVISLAIK